MSTVKTFYDTNGKTSETALPHAAGQGDGCGDSCHDTSTTYDALGRPTLVEDGGGGILKYNYEAVTTNCVWPPTTSDIRTDEWFSYDARGETTDLWESTPHSGSYYHSNATYWANGALDALSGPGGYYTDYGLDGEGRVSSAGDGNHLAGTLYNAAGLPTQLNFPSGDSDTYAYDPNTNRMTQYSFKVNGQSLVGNLGWNANGTLASLSISDPFNQSNNQTCTYNHDDLARLATANCGSWSQTFSYDAFGNIKTSGSGQFEQGYNISNRVQCGTYDADGNATNDCENTYTWDAYGRPITVANSSGSVGVAYDALGRAVELDNSGAYTQLVYSPTGFKMLLMNGQSGDRSFVPLPAGETAFWIYSSGGPYYSHADWLGSSRFASTPGRTVYYDASYAPFGEAYAESKTTDRNFTGMDQDIVGGLYDFPAREYNALEGRWPSPDPAGLASVNPADPQAWNRYAYVRNSPLMLTDPFGLDDSSCMPFYVIGGVGVWCPLPIIPILPIGPGGCVSITIDGSSSPCSAPPSIPGGYGGGGGGGGGSAPGSGTGNGNSGTCTGSGCPTVTGKPSQTPQANQNPEQQQLQKCKKVTYIVGGLAATASINGLGAVLTGGITPVSWIFEGAAGVETVGAGIMGIYAAYVCFQQ